MTFEELQKANEQIKTTDIKGKAYSEVPQRIKAFRRLFPQGFIRTRLLSNENGVAIMQAEVGYYDTDEEREMVLATGLAYEKEGSTFINKTSYIENCETSAVGRALGMLGIGIDGSVASAEEVQNAQIQQAELEKLTKDQAKAAKAAIKNIGYVEEKILKHFGLEKIEDMNQKQFREFCAQCEKDRDDK